MTIRAFDTVELGIIDLVISKGYPFVARMVRLGAAFSLAALLRLILGLLDDITGRRLGRIGGVLFGGGEFSTELCHFRPELVHQLHQSGASLANRCIHAEMLATQAARSCASFLFFS